MPDDSDERTGSKEAVTASEESNADEVSEILTKSLGGGRRRTSGMKRVKRREHDGSATVGRNRTMRDSPTG
jgi:hypothetical protein